MAATSTINMRTCLSISGLFNYDDNEFIYCISLNKRGYVTIITSHKDEYLTPPASRDYKRLATDKTTRETILRTAQTTPRDL